MKYLIAGLGNMGPEYELTRHNVGFLVLDRLADNYKINFRTERLRLEHATARRDEIEFARRRVRGDVQDPAGRRLAAGWKTEAIPMRRRVEERRRTGRPLAVRRLEARRRQPCDPARIARARRRIDENRRKIEHLKRIASDSADDARTEQNRTHQPDDDARDEAHGLT